MNKNKIIDSKSQQNQEEGYFFYEGIFLSNEEVVNAFKITTDEYPRYPIVPKNFHVTTEFLPSVTHEELYGTKVSVHIIGYKYGIVQDQMDKSKSENEGFKVELQSDDPKMQRLIDSLKKNWHITGSYTTAAKHTEYIDFSNSKQLDITLIGIFGNCDSNDKMVLSKELL